MSIKIQGHSLTVVKDHSDFKVKTCFSQLGDLNQVHIKAYGRMGMKICINELGHMTKMASMPTYGKKNFKNLL